MKKSGRDGLGESLRRVLLKKPCGENAEKLEQLGLKRGNNLDVVAAAMFNKAAKGELPAIKEVFEIAFEDDGKQSDELSMLYEALEKEDT